MISWWRRRTVDSPTHSAAAISPRGAATPWAVAAIWEEGGGQGEM